MGLSRRSKREDVTVDQARRHEMSGTIVCGVDTSEAVGEVAAVARWLADALDERLVVAHVLGGESEQAEEPTSALRDRLTEPVEVTLVEGSPAEALLEMAGREGADFLVVGSRGRGALRSRVLGSVSRELATKARCPVVIVPPERSIEARAGAEGSIVCGVDGSAHSISAARVAARLATALGERLIVVHALMGAKAVASYLGARASNPPLSAQSDARTRLAGEIVEEAVSHLDHDAVGVVEPGAPWEVLQSVADREAGRMLVIAARGKGAVPAALFGSVAARLSASTTRPLVVIPEAAELSTAPGGRE
ncbi:MAG: universal stress protein [Solirubrobacterales bacterium]|nr:universal stress protein [Solirubrobacterales bacterium]